jgi:hypothetical protein
MSFWNSPLLKNLEGGELPEVKVKIEDESIVHLCIAITITGIVLILVWRIVKNVI